MLGIVVIHAWHSTQRETEFYIFLRAMAYSTAICFLLTSIALGAMSWRLTVSARLASLLIIAIAGFTLIEICCVPGLAVNKKIMLLVPHLPTYPMPMAGTTASSFLLASGALFLLSFPYVERPGKSFIVVIVLSCIILMVAIIALLGHGLGHLSAFKWLGIKMSVQASIAFIIFALALMAYSYPFAVIAFGRLNFFSHMVVAFGFMALVFIGTGSIVLTQIDSIAAIVNEPHQDTQALHQRVMEIKFEAKQLIIFSIIGFLALGLSVVYMITRLLSNQLHQLRQAMLDIAHRREGVKIPFIDHAQEIGDMARALAVFAANVNTTRRMEARMRQIIEAAPNGIVMINEEGTIEIVNQQAENIFAYDRSELLGHPVEMLVPSHRAGSHPHERATFFSDPAPRAMGAGRELYGARKGGEQFPIEIGLAPIETDEGLKVLASIVDISERKKNAQLLVEHQRDLEKSNRELARINRELETFAYVASHDLKSPLRGIAQLSTWIEEDLQTREYDTVSGHTQMLRSRILRMEKLLDDLLTFYRAGKIDTSQRDVDTRFVALGLFEMQNTKPGLRLEVDGDMPVFSTLATPFEQVVRNLFSNAIKHHDKEEGVIRISCRDVDDSYYAFSVSDDGPGIPEQYHQRVFGMFQTLKPRDELEGSGMGLALIKKIVENYGGYITVNSVGRGTCFIFTWPKQWRTINA